MNRTALIRARPSSAHRWVGGGCPGSVRQEAQYPDGGSLAAAEGTRLHDLAAGALTDPTVYGGMNDDDAEIVKPYVDDVWKVSEAGSDLIVEGLTSWRERPELEGTPDAVFWNHATHTLTVWDLKTGWGIVEVWMNWQLLCYATMLLSHYAEPDLWTIELRIVQPRAFHPDGPIRTWTLEYKELQAYSKTIGQALTDALREGAPLRPGRACMYCAALASCTAARHVTLAAVEYAARDRLDIHDDFVGRELEILRATEKLLKQRTEALEEEIAVRLRNGASIPGVALASGSGGRTKWAVSDAQAKWALEVFTGMDHSKVKMPTPKQLIDAGVDATEVNRLTHYQPGKLKVVTDANDRTKQMFATAPDLTHAKDQS